MATIESGLKTTAIAQWFGSNRLLAKEVGRELAGCEWVGVPFAGGMCELAHIDARSIVVNDLHKHVINLARTVADPIRGPRLYRHLRRVPFHPIALIAAQSRCREREAMDQPNTLYGGSSVPGEEFEWAVDYFIATWMGRGGNAGTLGEFNGALSVRWNAGGGDSAVRFQSATEALVAWRRIMKRCTFQTMDALNFIEKIKDQAGHGTYCDPPFPGPGDAYKHVFSEHNHRELAVKLAAFTKTRCVCRFYDHPLIRELYPESRWAWRHLVGGKKRTNEDAPEVLLIG